MAGGIGLLEALGGKGTGILWERRVLQEGFARKKCGNYNGKLFWWVSG